jgi:hypothetical protein
MQLSCMVTSDTTLTDVGKGSPVLYIATAIDYIFGLGPFAPAQGHSSELTVCRGPKCGNW